MATMIGAGAVALWSLLAVLTVLTAPVPPFQLNAVCFLIGGCAGLVWTVATGKLTELRRVPLGVLAFGTLGLFGYHALYFFALRLAPPAQAGLIAYLWPLLIVLFSGLLPGEALRTGHILGAAIAFAGAGLILIGGGASVNPGAAAGYGLAFLCALTWSGYSVLSRRMAAIPTTAVTGFCLATAGLSAGLHLMVETTVWPSSWHGWAAMAGLGAGPVGLAFFFWDVGVKRGDIQLLGVLSYAAPLLSTCVLILAGQAAASITLLSAAILIAAGAALAARASAQNRQA